jgi:hypothetical protein
MTDHRTRKNAPWRRHLTAEETKEMALLDWQIEVYDIGRRALASRRLRIANRATQRARAMATKGNATDG